MLAIELVTPFPLNQDCTVMLGRNVFFGWKFTPIYNLDWRKWTKFIPGLSLSLARQQFGLMYPPKLSSCPIDNIASSDVRNLVPFQSDGSNIPLSASPQWRETPWLFVTQLIPKRLIQTVPFIVFFSACKRLNSSAETRNEHSACRLSTAPIFCGCCTKWCLADRSDGLLHWLRSL